MKNDFLNSILELPRQRLIRWDEFNSHYGKKFKVMLINVSECKMNYDGVKYLTFQCKLIEGFDKFKIKANSEHVYDIQFPETSFTYALDRVREWKIDLTQKQNIILEFSRDTKKKMSIYMAELITQGKNKTNPEGIPGLVMK